MGTDCLLYKFKPSDEFKLLTGVTKRLTSMLIAMGPSILYRLRHNSIYWKEAADENVRGTMMKSLRANINNKLNITCYYKSNLDQESGLQAPSRITFSGSDPSSVLFLTKENLILDIFSQGMDSTKDLSRTVKPLPGVGCSAFYGNSVPTPTMNSHLVHLILSETITSSTTTKTVSEIYANDRLKLVRIQKPNSKSEALYDYSLGLVYQFQEGESCKVSPVKRGSIGLSQETGQFHLTRLFLLDGNYKYLGKMYLENRPEFAAKVWESISYNSTVNSDKYDKVVTTQYFTETVDNYGFDGHLSS
ncbi:uncharacterized protein LOC128392427 [Panonychus citri]|uniref:uncharacterized protein LOC128392427 n=1 Tax=Panonychus citri TaxID=50023 RepID=UPI00230737E2|nr:uncharacterized protein LOC128392427 [Panonychus citri]